jgi:hypothetical protein
MSGLLAQFDSQEALLRAVSLLRAQQIALETYTPVPLTASPSGSPLPLIVLAAGLLGAAAGFGMQVYAVMVSYPQDIGGRPAFSWPSFVPIAFEVGALCAVLTAFLGFFVANRLPKLYEPIDECLATRGALRDAWIVAVQTRDPDVRDRARATFLEIGARRIEDIPS